MSVVALPTAVLLLGFSNDHPIIQMLKHPKREH
jgi:hypothetical protein